jgi:prolyl oligopeptidase
MAAVTPWTVNNYPSARQSDHVDVYKSKAKGEVRVSDPYQWLEHNTDETDKWTTAQEAFTREYLDKNPDRQILEDEIRKNTDYAKVPRFSFYTLRSCAHTLPVFPTYLKRRRALVLVL